MQDFKLAIVVFNEGGATFNPVPIVAVKYAVDVPDLCMMDMSTNYTIYASFLGEMR